mmetsp:Transcript_8648/g.19226  ORF Transcript_8648/g.19226 Transcript_8648/m.19226 type:complete len:200 (-) Transcript_8648:945-1544(-)
MEMMSQRASPARQLHLHDVGCWVQFHIEIAQLESHVRQLRDVGAVEFNLGQLVNRENGFGGAGDDVGACIKDCCALGPLTKWERTFSRFQERADDLLHLLHDLGPIHNLHSRLRSVQLLALAQLLDEGVNELGILTLETVLGTIVVCGIRSASDRGGRLVSIHDRGLLFCLLDLRIIHADNFLLRGLGTRFGHWRGISL